MLNKLKARKEKYFSSWIEFIVTLGTSPIEKMGYMVCIYVWMPLFWIIVLIILLNNQN